MLIKSIFLLISVTFTELISYKMGKVFSVDLILKAKDLLNFDSKKRQSLGESVVIFEELKTTIKGNQLKVEGQVLRF